MALRDLTEGRLDQEYNPLKEKKEKKKGFLEDFTWFDRPTRMEDDELVPGRAGALSRLGSAMMNIGRIAAAPYGTNLPAGRDIAGEEESVRMKIMEEQLRQKNMEKQAKLKLKEEEETRSQANLDKLKYAAASAGIPKESLIGINDEDKLLAAISGQKANIAQLQVKKLQDALNQTAVNKALTVDFGKYTSREAIEHVKKTTGAVNDMEAKEQIAAMLISKHGIDQALQIRRSLGLSSGAAQENRLQQILDRLEQQGL